MNDIFWGAASLAVLVLLVGLLIIMITDDVRNVMAQRGAGHGRERSSPSGELLL
jgi:hypothetical protein